jgi:MFS family permease
VLAIGVIFVGIGGFYVITTFMLAYATEQVGVSDSTILDAVIFAGFVELVAILPFALLSDRVGRRPVGGLGAAAMVVLAFPLFWLVDTGRPALIWLGMGAIILAGSAHYAVISSFVAEMFDARIRYSGLALSYQLSGAIGGATAPLVATALLDVDGGASWPVAIYLAAMAAISAMSIALAPETFRRPIGEPRAVAVPDGEPQVAGVR